MLAVFPRVQKVQEKIGNNIRNDRKGKARCDRNPCRSGRKIDRELNIPRERMQHKLKNELRLKTLKLQKVQELIDGQKNVRLKRDKKLLRLHESMQLPNLVFTDVKPFQTEQFGTNKMIGFTCQKGQLDMYICDWSPELKRR